MLNGIVRATAWLTLLGGTGVFVFVQWRATHGRLELTIGILMVLLFARIVKRAIVIAGVRTALAALVLSLFVTTPIWQNILLRILGDPRHSVILSATALWFLLAIVLLIHVALRETYVPVKPGRREIVKGEIPEQSVSRVAASFRDKKVFLDWDRVFGEDRPLTDLARSVVGTVKERLRREGAQVGLPMGQEDYSLSFSWTDQPLFTFKSKRSGEQRILRPVRWAGRGPRHMKEDAAVQGLYFFAVFIAEDESQRRSIDIVSAAGAP